MTITRPMSGVLGAFLMGMALIGCSSREPQKIACNESTPNLKFFSSTTGEPVVFYHRTADGKGFVCFNGPGYDPWTGEKLEGVTQDIRAEILRQPAPVSPAPLPQGRVFRKTYHHSEVSEVNVYNTLEPDANEEDSEDY